MVQLNLLRGITNGTHGKLSLFTYQLIVCTEYLFDTRQIFPLHIAFIQVVENGKVELCLKFMSKKGKLQMP